MIPTINNSNSNNSNNTSPGIKSIKSRECSNSVASSKRLTPILSISQPQSSPVPSFVTDSTHFIKRAQSNGSMASMSTLNTSKISGSSTLPSTADSTVTGNEIEEKKEESRTASGNNSNDGDGNDTNDLLLNEDNNINDEDYLFHDDDRPMARARAPKTSVSRKSSNFDQDEILTNIHDENTNLSIPSSHGHHMVLDQDHDATENLLSDARKYLMEKVNLSDLNMNDTIKSLDLNMTSRSFDHVLIQMNHLNMNVVNNPRYSLRQS